MLGKLPERHLGQIMERKQQLGARMNLRSYDRLRALEFGVISTVLMGRSEWTFTFESTRELLILEEQTTLALDKPTEVTLTLSAQTDDALMKRATTFWRSPSAVCKRKALAGFKKAERRTGCVAWRPQELALAEDWWTARLYVDEYPFPAGGGKGSFRCIVIGPGKFRR